MKFLNYLKEEYVAAAKGGYRDRTEGAIFVNPTVKELEELSDDDVRFIIDKKNKKIFVWQGNIFHYQALRELKKLNLISGTVPGFSDKDADRDLRDEDFWKSYYAGVGKVVSGKIKFIMDSDYAREVDDKVVDDITDYKWTNKFIIWH